MYCNTHKIETPDCPQCKIKRETLDKVHHELMWEAAQLAEENDDTNEVANGFRWFARKLKEEDYI